MRKSYHEGGYRENGENITNKKNGYIHCKGFDSYN
jgi:hypothetical protein